MELIYGCLGGNAASPWRDDDPHSRQEQADTPPREPSAPEEHRCKSGVTKDLKRAGKSAAEPETENGPAMS
jgi:hypothetical protein